MPLLSVSAMVRCADAFVRGAVQMLGLTLVLAVFLPVAPGLVFWPLMPEGKLFQLLKLYRDWALTIITWGGLATDPADGERAPKLNVVPS
jgi:hypothetical protein